MEIKRYKIVVFAPEDRADALRIVMGDAGAGKIGNYTYCTFSTKGVGRSKPEEGAHPAIGEVGTIESIVEERIETVCTEENLERVLAAIKSTHPYEEPATDVYLLEDV